MSNKSIKKNYIYNLFYQLLTLITPLITTPYIARVLGADGVGTSSYTNSIVTYFLLVAVLGTADYGQREIAYRQDKPESRSRMFWEIFILRCLTSFLSLVTFLTITGFSEFRILFLIQAINILAVAFDIAWFFQGMEEFGKTVFRNTLVRVFNVVFIFWFVKDHNDLPIYIASMALTTLIGHLSIWLYLPKYLCAVERKTIKPFHNLKGVIQLFIPQIAVQVSAVMDKTMLGMIAESTFENGYYEQADRIEKICLTIVSSLGIVMIPRISYIYANNNIENLKKYIYRAYRFIWFLAIPMTFGLISIADKFIPWFLGSGYEKTIILVQIMSTLLCIVGISSVTGVQYFIPTGKQNQFTVSVIIGGSVNLILNFILIPKYLSLGAAIATVISEMTITVIQLIMAKNEFNIGKIMLLSSKYFVSAVIMMITLLNMKSYLQDDLMGTFLLILIGSLVYFGSLIFLKDDMIGEIWDKRFKIKRM